MTEYVPQDLVNAFVASVAQRFRTLEQIHSLQRSLGAKVLGPSGIQHVKPEKIGNRFFMLKLVLTGPRFSVSITYGDREHDLSCLIHSGAHQQAYALWEWLQVLGMNELQEDAGGWVLTAPRIDAVLSQFERALEQLVPILVNEGTSLEHQLEEQRQQNIRLDQQRMTEDEHWRLAAKAAESFHRHDYSAVVKALLAVRGELSPSEKAKLAYAKKKINR